MTRLFLALALLTGVAASPARASKVENFPGEMIVRDDAGLFTAEAVEKAKAAFSGTMFHGHVKFAVHTVKAIPESKKAEFDLAAKDATARNHFFEAWARELAKQDGGNPVVALVYMDGKRHVTRVVSDSAASRDRGRQFSDDKANAIARRFQTALDGVLKGDNLHAKLDQALTEATELLINDLRNTTPASANHSTSATHDGGGGKGIMSYVCIGVCVLAGVWLVIGLIRAFTGGGGGGGMGGGMGGGGGGGFMSSLLGGMFGTMAGMWMYNSFFGGGMGSLGAHDSMTGNDAGGDYNTGEGDYDGGASAGADGGDWGDSGGGDVGGGGDWGGGGDFGGGDFGGGDW